MQVVNLYDYSDDGFLQDANTDSVTRISHVRFYYDDFTGSNYVQGSFVTGYPATVEYDESGVAFTKFKMFESTDGTTYTENKRYGGTIGRDVANPAVVMDAADGTDNQVATNYQGTGVIWKSLSGIFSDEGLDLGGVDYLFCRGVLCQHNDVNSGKAFFGSITVLSDGSFNAVVGNPELTIASSYSNSRSQKIGTGRYALQFRSNLPLADGFVTGLQGASFIYKFENATYPIYKTLEPVDVGGGVYEGEYTFEKTGELTLNCYYDTLNYYELGELVIETRDVDGNLADNLLFNETIEFRAFMNLL